MPATTFAPAVAGRTPRPGDLAEARRQLLAAALVGPEQEALRRRVLDFVDRHPDALHRCCAAGHLTGSAVVVHPVHQRVVLLHHRKLDRWLQPGGHADGDGDLAGVALREAVEETGLGDLCVVTPAIELDVHPIPARGGDPDHLHLDLRFLVLAGADTDPVVNHESHAVTWVDAAGLVRYDVRGELRRLVERGLAVAEELGGR